MEPETLLLPDDGVVPNNPRLPALLWRGALPPGEPEAAEARFAAHGWPPAWRNGIYPYHHYHPNAHEALAIARGQVRVQLGGEQGQVLELQAGDVVALPAGVGHRNLSASADLLVVGAYPAGQEPKEYRAEKRLHDAAIAAIIATPDPPCEPLTGQPWPGL
ncbi:cupin domain-containing protein [Siccirubricoccus phaeus]|uniref:cupin domain-containing protein n=1 Tax=Siccirubricoccus phaeus TaxID=2595053 RepID=UPI001A9C68C8|nr:cupin domain-containing protein [Siccirubricoccus phaeus]